MSVRSRVLPVSFGAVLMSALIAAACSEPASPSVATAEVVKVSPAASFCADGYPPPPPTDTSAAFEYDGGAVTMLDGEVALLPASSIAATAGEGFLRTYGGLAVQTTFMVNDANGNGFVSFEKVPTMISASARIVLRDCIPTSGQGTITLLRTDGKIVFDLRAANAITGTAALCNPNDLEQQRLGCFSLGLSGGYLYDLYGRLLKTDATATFTLGVRCTYPMQDAGICTVPIEKEVIG